MRATFYSSKEELTRALPSPGNFPLDLERTQRFMIVLSEKQKALAGRRDQVVLTAADLKRINALAQPAGTRYDAANLRFVNA